MHDNQKVRFFDEIASKWDGWENLDLLAAKLSSVIEEFGVKQNETILDVGCGTGNLTQALLNKLGKEGRVMAVDFSSAMVAEAQRKISDPRVKWYVADVAELPLEDESVDRVICYSVWPHLENHQAVLQELRRVLRRDGTIHVWHLSSRKTINEVHASAGVAVNRDILRPAKETAHLFEQHGLATVVIVDDDSRYVVSAVKR
ncbi:MAG: class I SAM-dependent methyltransferase [Pseudomonadota bacterium]